MHHCIVGRPLHGMVTDHINRNGLDNRNNNLRIVSNRFNCSNTRKKAEGRTSSTYTGVCWHKQVKKWRAYASIRKKHIHLGLFTDEKEAAKAHQTALTKIEKGEQIKCTTK